MWMRTRSRRNQSEKKKGFKAVIINQSIFCVILIISVMCVNSVNKTQTNVFIQNVKHSLYTSIDYKKTAQNIKNLLERIINERENNDDKEKADKPVPTDNGGETS